MIVLTALRKVLQDDAQVSGYATGGIYFLEVAQDAARPNVMLMTMTGSDDWTHQGPDNLNQDVVRIYSRGDSAEQAIVLAERVRTAINGYVEAAARYGIAIDLVQHINTTGDYQDGAKVFRQIDDYRVTYRRD
jgi:hypothetical protein